MGYKITYAASYPKKHRFRNYYKIHPFDIMEPDAYISLICDLISIIPEEIVIHRLTGDGLKRRFNSTFMERKQKIYIKRINKKNLQKFNSRV